MTRFRWVSQFTLKVFESCSSLIKDEYTDNKLRNAVMSPVYIPPRESMFLAQQELRHCLLDHPSSISYSKARDLAAHLLLLIEDSTAAWQECVTWLRIELDVERVDGGFASPQQKLYFPGQAESIYESCEITTIKGLKVDNYSSAVKKIWRMNKPVVFTSLEKDTLFEPSCRKALITNGIESKMAISLKKSKQAFGLICIDRSKRRFALDWQQSQYDIVESVVREVISPIMYQIHLLDNNTYTSIPKTIKYKSLLTAAEMRVACLAASGLSYKEIARQNCRSIHTIDHQLRNIRKKLNVDNNASLVALLNKI